MAVPFQKTFLRQSEWGLAVLLTVAAVWLHFFYLIHAGGLWRDEISVKSIATLPSFGQVWEALPHDHCPILFPSLVRIWSASGLGTTDIGLRILGLGCQPDDGPGVATAFTGVCRLEFHSHPIW